MSLTSAQRSPVYRCPLGGKTLGESLAPDSRGCRGSNPRMRRLCGSHPPRSFPVSSCVQTARNGPGECGKYPRSRMCYKTDTILPLA